MLAVIYGKSIKIIIHEWTRIFTNGKEMPVATTLVLKTRFLGRGRRREAAPHQVGLVFKFQMVALMGRERKNSNMDEQDGQDKGQTTASCSSSCISCSSMFNCLVFSAPIRAIRGYKSGVALRTSPALG